MNRCANNCCIHTRIFPAGRMDSPPQAKHLLTLFLHQEKFTPSRLSTTKFLSLLTNNNCHVIIPKKASYLAAVNAPVPFTLTWYSLYTQFILILILIDVQYLQNAVFSFKKCWNGQIHSSWDSYHPIKKLQ